MGVDLPNNTVIFSVCYTAVGAAGMTSPFTFTSLPGFAVEIVKEPGGEVIPALNNGSVFIWISNHQKSWWIALPWYP